MNLYYFLLFFLSFSFARDLIQQINKKIEDIDFIQEKITKIETFLNYALDHEPIKKLLDFLTTNKLFTKDITLKNEYSFSDLKSLINETPLIEYIKKNNISKNTIEKILNDAFGKNEEREIISFVKNIFDKITLQEKKEKLKQSFNKELEKLNLSPMDIVTDNPKSMSKFIDEANKKEDKIKSKIENYIEKQEKLLEARIQARKKKKN